MEGLSLLSTKRRTCNRGSVTLTTCLHWAQKSTSFRIAMISFPTPPLAYVDFTHLLLVTICRSSFSNLTMHWRLRK
uniref:Uncharacterized protein n=1 Tax=Arundo donax TaxID=35708 RepID=A0A0A9GB64_ARUDO